MTRNSAGVYFFEISLRILLSDVSVIPKYEAICLSDACWKIAGLLSSSFIYLTSAVSVIMESILFFNPANPLTSMCRPNSLKAGML